MWMLASILAAEVTLEDLINEAAQQKNWPLLVGALVIVLVPAVLKLLGKQIPIIDSAVDLAKKALPMLRKKDVPPPAAGEKEGLAAIIPIEGKKDDKGPTP